MEEMLTLDQFIDHWAKERPDDRAMQDGESVYSYAELEARTRRIANMLKAKGLGKGDRIAWLGKNSQLYFSLLYGAARMGVVMVPIGWRLAPAEISYIAEDTGAKIIFAGEGFTGTAQQVTSEIATSPEVISTEDAESAIANAATDDFERAGPEDGALQLYTSGTTGRPKGAVLANKNLLGLKKPGEEADEPWSHYDAGEAVLVCMPCAHIGGTGLGLLALTGGVAGVIQAEFEPGAVLEAFEQGITRLFVVPAALQMIIQHPKAKQTDFSSIKYVIYGAAPIPLDLLREAVETISNAGFLQAYGMTETSGTICVLPPDDHDLSGTERMRSAGRACPGVELKVVGENDEELPRGEIGELWIKSPSNMTGYWNLPEATESSLTDGWMHTGDAAILDKDGYVFIQDRIKDMIISGGENVYPAEVESAIYGHPAIAEVAVIGVPDDKWGEAVKACVVCKPGEQIDEQDVIAFTRERLAAFKAPKSVDIIDALPRNPTGKILRRELRAPYWKGRDRQVN